MTALVCERVLIGDLCTEDGFSPMLAVANPEGFH